MYLQVTQYRGHSVRSRNTKFTLCLLKDFVKVKPLVDWGLSFFKKVEDRKWKIEN
jgi:hypothetical protein